MKIVKLSTLKNVEKFGTCAECGKNSDAGDLYRIVTETKTGVRTFHSSLCLCGECMRILQKQMGEVLALIKCNAISPENAELIIKKFFGM